MEGILMKKNTEITVLSETVRVQRIAREDFISLTDIAKQSSEIRMHRRTSSKIGCAAVARSIYLVSGRN